jgi:hypothetical protein
MKLNLVYNEDKDVECLLSKGNSSNNSPGQKTKTYEELLTFTKDIEDKEKVSEFVRKYIHDNNIDVEHTTAVLQNNWDIISERFEKRATDIFGVKIKDIITGYLTITGRFPYNITNKYFYVPAQTSNVNRIAMHELWHFYTLYKFGEQKIKNMGPQKYNDVKEALTVLLNIECADLMNGKTDFGYPQHQQLRNIAMEEWKKTKDIENVWNTLEKQV